MVMSRRVRRVVFGTRLVAVWSAVWLWWPAVPVWAQIPNPPAPGAELVSTGLGWLKWAGLASALAGLLIGAIATGVGHFGSNYSASSAGRKWLLGGMASAILAGLAWTIATTLYSATGG
jgi:hypothetical protein